MRLHFSYTLLETSLLGKDVAMGGQKEKRSDFDPPHSKMSRDGVHTVVCGLEARTVVASENECDTHELC